MAEAATKSLPEDDALREMMVRYQRADPLAAEQLVRVISPVLFRFLASSVLTRSDTEDLLQESWLRIHKARHTYDPERPLLPWILAIARHTRLDGHRRRRRIESRELSMEGVRERALPAEHEAELAHYDLLRFLDNLPESQREVLLMLKVLGMSLEDVARATSSTVGSVKQKAHRAYEKLRRIFRSDARNVKNELQTDE